MATLVYLDIDQGSDFSAVLTLENDDGTPMNLQGFEVYSQFRKSYGSTIGYQFTTTVINDIGGVMQLELLGDISSSIKPGRYLYDVEIINTVSGRKTRVVEGIVTINPEITKIP